jgi:hypothetical protein
MTDVALLHNLLRDHFAPAPLAGLVMLRARFPQWLRPDVEGAVRAVVDSAGSSRFAAPRLPRAMHAFQFQEILQDGRRGASVGAPQYEEVDIGVGRHQACLQRGLWLAGEDGQRIAVLIDVVEGFRRASVRVEVAAPEASCAFAEKVLGRIRAAAEAAPTFRGQVLAPSAPAYAFDDDGVSLRVIAFAPVQRSEIVLAPGILDMLDRNTLEFSGLCGSLRALGMPVSKGVLLYGPPGTGKTLLVRYLVGALASHTRFLLSGERLDFLRDTVEAARLLAPSLIVIEDIDLVAAHRDGPFQQTPAALNRLLNDMDGAGRESQILFLLTTNRPEVLEPALAMRPGRVDQAIEIGLPGEAERNALLRLYTKRVQVGDDAIRHASVRAGRVSPAFLREVARRSVQVMLARGGETLLPRDFDAALADIQDARGKVTTHLFGAARIGF